MFPSSYLRVLCINRIIVIIMHIPHDQITFLLVTFTICTSITLAICFESNSFINIYKYINFFVTPFVVISFSFVFVFVWGCFLYVLSNVSCLCCVRFFISWNGLIVYSSSKNQIWFKFDDFGFQMSVCFHGAMR